MKKMKKLNYLLLILLSVFITQTSFAQNDQTIYQFKVKDINGNTFDFASLKGKKIMIVNTASKCGFTPQYEGLEKLYKKYKDKGFVVVGFPANDFKKQEPGTNAEIAEFCKENYGVTFPMMAKIHVRGEEIHPVYQFLTQKSKNGYMDSKVGWNFQKYLIDTHGKLVRIFAPKIKPEDPNIIEWIEGKRDLSRFTPK